MKPSSCSINRWAAAPLLATLFLASLLHGQDTAGGSAPAASLSDPGTKVFEAWADQALQAMTKRAEELRIKGVAVVAYIPGDTAKSWSSKMAVAGAMKNEPSGNNRGANLLAIAYTKAAEMADTLQDSGSGARPAMTGETGWKGGVVKKAKAGYVIAAFSGGSSEDDVRVSRVGLEILLGRL